MAACKPQRIRGGAEALAAKLRVIEVHYTAVLVSPSVLVSQNGTCFMCTILVLYTAHTLIPTVLYFGRLKVLALVTRRNEV